VDSKDFQLLVALHENTRQSYQSLGRRVSLSAPAVRDRLKRLESAGILKGYILSVDPSLFDRDEQLVFFQKGEFTRQDAVKALGVRDVAWVAWKVDGGLTVQVWPRDRSQLIKDLEAVLGAHPSGQAIAERRSHRRPLSLLDWQIIDVLVDDPRMPLEDLCKSTGLSPKTARKHLENLVQDEAIFISPQLGALTDSGDLVYTLAVFGKMGMDDLCQIMGDIFLVNETQEPPAKYLLCRGSDLGDVTEKTHALSKVPGVETVNVTLNREQLFATELLHSLVREKIRAWEDSRYARSEIRRLVPQ
jgi:DNA-binding Lrp family transcriptional regulator